MSQVVLSPDEARVLSAIPPDGETTLTQAAVDVRALPAAVRKAVDGLVEKKLAMRTPRDHVGLLPEGRRVRELVASHRATPGVVMSGAAGSDFLKYVNPLHWFSEPAPAVRVLILPEQPAEDGGRPVPSPEELDKAIADELARQKAAGENGAVPER